MNTNRLIVLAIAICGALSCYAADPESQATRNEALAAPAADLAQSYLWVKMVTENMLPAAKGGATIHLSDGTITKSNVEKYEKIYRERLSIYRDAIKQRGYTTIAEAYKGTATESCARVRSMWGLVLKGNAESIRITQDGFEAKITITLKHEGEKADLDMPGIIVESSIVLQEPLNSSYFFRGVIKDKEIELKPDVSVLRTWPQWAGPPKRKDLKRCTITLVLTSGDSET